MATAYIIIGSNTGDRRSNIERAAACIAASFMPGKTIRSQMTETEPWGYSSPNAFLNLGIATDIGDTPPLVAFRMLMAIQDSICSAAHRDSTGAYIDRIIDIDLIAIDDTVIDTPELTLPHPRMHLRDFVVRPMLELCPEWVHPLLNKTILEIAQTYK